MHLAGYSGHVTIIEILVGYGANINITSSDGSSVLHIILGKDNMEDPDKNSPQIKKVSKSLRPLECTMFAAYNFGSVFGVTEIVSFALQNYFFCLFVVLILIY